MSDKPFDPTKTEVSPGGYAHLKAQVEAAHRELMQDDSKRRATAAEKLIRKRAALWSKRSDKWHSKLDTERKWTWRGVAAPILFGSTASLVLAMCAVYGVRALWLTLVTPAATVLGALVGWRALAARVQLDAGQIETAWVIADRVYTHYESMVATLDDLSGKEYEDEIVIQSQSWSDKIEATARFGLPPELQKLLEECPREDRLIIERRPIHSSHVMGKYACQKCNYSRDHVDIGKRCIEG